MIATNSYGYGFSAKFSNTNSLETFDLDLTYYAGGNPTDETFGVCMSADEAEALSDLLIEYAATLREKNSVGGF